MISRLTLGIYRRTQRGVGKLFSLLIRGAFASFGCRTVFMLPLRLDGERYIEVGSGVFLGSGCWLHASPEKPSGTVIFIGNGTSVAGQCVISAVREVRLEENVLLARNVYISDHIHGYSNVGQPILAQGVDKVKPVLIGRGAWLGQNVVVCPGAVIGAGSVIGANSVVTVSIPAYSVAVGAPARVVKQFGTPSRVEI